jgi:ATP-binding cassette, subfamily B, bacterial PglK
MAQPSGRCHVLPLEAPLIGRSLSQTKLGPAGCPERIGVPEQTPGKPMEFPSISSLRKSIYLLGLEKRSRWMLLVAMALVASAFEILGAALVFALVGLASGETTGVSLPLIGDVDSLLGLDEDVFLLAVIAAMAFFFVARGFVHVVRVYIQDRAIQNAGARLSTRMVEGYLTLPYAFHLRRNSSDIIRNAYQAVDELISRIYGPIINIAAEGAIVLGMLAFLLMLAPGATLMAVAVLGFAAAVLLLVVQPRIKRLGQRAHLMRRETLATLQHSLHGIRDVKLLGREHAFARSYGRSRISLARSNYLSSTAYSLPSVVMEIALLGVVLSIFGFALIRGEATQEALPVLGIFAYAGLRLQPSLQKIIGGVNQMKYASAPLEDIFADLQLIEAEADTHGQPKEPLQLTAGIALEGVSFRYQGSTRDAISDLDLEIRPGEFIGICGATGGGKTTLVDLIVGLLAPTAGRITIDGTDLQRAVRRWHENLGVVSQAVFLTDQTFRQNIALGIPNDQIDEAAIDEAVHLAQLDGFVRSLPEGLNTMVGERGVRVSGGQRQRIAIARALYRRPSVLVFDEGTSALDNTTERELMAAFDRLRGERTIVMVAHRLTTVKGADRIVYLDDGRVSGVGTYDSLLSTHSGFQRLATN